MLTRAASPRQQTVRERGATDDRFATENRFVLSLTRTGPEAPVTFGHSGPLHRGYPLIALQSEDNQVLRTWIAPSCPFPSEAVLMEAMR